MKRTMKIERAKRRERWEINPATHIEPSGKVYDRRREKAKVREEWEDYLASTTPEEWDQISFCPRCSGRLGDQTLEGVERLVCDECGYIFYINPTPAAGAVVLDGGNVLWVKRALDPHKGSWCLPAGFVEYWESAEECAIREVKEETGLDIDGLELLGVYSGGDDPRTRVILIIYLTQTWLGQLSAGDDASEVGWFKLDEPPEEIAFRAHLKALEDARMRVV